MYYFDLASERSPKDFTPATLLAVAGLPPPGAKAYGEDI